MSLDAAALGDLLRRLPSLARPELSGRAQAALAETVALATAPARARDAVPDAALRAFTGGARTLDPDAGNAWAPAPAVAPAPAATDPRVRAIAAVNGVPAPAAEATAVVSGPPTDPASATSAPALAAKISLAAAATALLEHAPASRRAIGAIEQARAAAGRLVQALTASAAAGEPWRRMPAAAASTPATHPDPVFAAADGVLAALRDAVGAAPAPDDAFASAPARDALDAARAGLAGLRPIAAEPLAQAVANPIAALAVASAARVVPPPTTASPQVAPRVVPTPPGPFATEARAAPSHRDASADWGRRSVDAAPPRTDAAPSPDGSALPPYDAATAGALAGIAAAVRLMRRQGLGGPGDPGALDRLGETIEAFDRASSEHPPLDADDHDRLMQWACVARQTAFVRTRLGLDLADPDQHAELAAALDDRARWLARRSPWPGRSAAGANLWHWLPLVDCADAFGLPTRGRGALRDLGHAIRSAALHPLPTVRDLTRTARMLSALDAVATVEETFGLDTASQDAGSRLRAVARAVETLPDAPAADAAGALDSSAITQMRRVDLDQADALRLDGLGRTPIPLLGSGLPVLASLDAARRCRARRLVVRS